MSELLFTEDHTCLRREGAVRTVGVTDYQLQDVVFVDLPDEGRIIQAGERVGEVETVAGARPVYSPISGRVNAKNEGVEVEAGRVNKSPLDHGWLFSAITEPDADTIKLLTPGEYEQLIG